MMLFTDELNPLSLNIYIHIYLYIYMQNNVNDYVNRLYAKIPLVFLAHVFKVERSYLKKYYAYH